MKITRIRDAVAPIPSPMRNAVISFDKMTISVLAVETDVIRDGKPVIGYGFCSNGRYAQSGVIRERLAPRILEADPAKLRDEKAGTFDPHAIWAALMSNETPGGHGERAFAAGGYVVHTFPTGQGNIIGNPIVPVIKISANPKTLRTMGEHIDVDVTGILRRDMTLDTAGDALIDMIVRTANGRLTAAEALGHREFVMTKLYRSA